MKYNKYVIEFEYLAITVYASCEKEAEILAQAEAIKKGLDYTIVSLKELEY